MEEEPKKEETVVEEIKTEEVKNAEPIENSNEKMKGFFQKIVDFVKEKWILCVSVLAGIILVIILACVFLGGKTKAIKTFVSGMNGKNASKIINSIDFAGAEAWKYSYDSEDFDSDDYKEFIEDYKEIDKDDIKEAKEDAKETFEDGFDELKDTYKTYKLKIEKIKSTEKIGKDLYAIDAKMSIYAKPKDKDDNELDRTETFTFIVYKGKIVYSALLGLI